MFWSQAKNYSFREAVAEFEKSIELQPNVDGAHGQLGLVFSHIGRMQEGLLAFRQAHRVNPHDSWVRWSGLAHLWAGEFETANRECEAWLRESPKSKYALWLRPQPLLLMGDLKAAEKMLRESLDEFPEEPLFVSLQGMLHAQRGEAERALECAQRACESPRSFGHTHHTLYQVACVHSILGQDDKALAWMDRAVSTGFRCWPFFRVDPSLSNLRRLPAFQNYIAEIEKDCSQFVFPKFEPANHEPHQPLFLPQITRLLYSHKIVILSGVSWTGGCDTFIVAYRNQGELIFDSTLFCFL